MAVSKKQQASVTKYVSTNYDRISVTVPKGQLDAIKDHANKHDGGSVNGFIKRAINETIERDGK